MKITITNIHFPYSIQLSILMAPYLRLKGNEMLFIFIIYFSIYYICYIHHWGQEKNRDCFCSSGIIRENKQTKEHQNAFRQTTA